MGITGTIPMAGNTQVSYTSLDSGLWGNTKEFFAIGAAGPQSQQHPSILLHVF
jgi:hypothetical protein